MVSTNFTSTVSHVIDSQNYKYLSRLPILSIIMATCDTGDFALEEGIAAKVQRSRLVWATCSNVHVVESPADLSTASFKGPTALSRRAGTFCRSQAEVFKPRRNSYGNDQQGRIQQEICVVLYSSGIHTRTSRPHPQGPQNWARVSRRELVRRRHRRLLLKKGCRKAHRDPNI